MTQLEGQNYPGCQVGEAGIWGFTDEVRCHVSIETMMSCGCGGYVDHSVHHCTQCERYFLFAYEEHWLPSREDAYVAEIGRSEAQALVARLRECPNLDKRNCGCDVHRGSKFLYKETKGQRPGKTHPRLAGPGKEEAMEDRQQGLRPLRGGSEPS